MTTDQTTTRVAVITGASSGISEATAHALARDGYRVALLARRLDRITRLAEELGDGSIAIQADVTDRDSLVAAAARVKHELGDTGVLINNAAVEDPRAEDEVERLLQLVEGRELDSSYESRVMGFSGGEDLTHGSFLVASYDGPRRALSGSIRLWSQRPSRMAVRTIARASVSDAGICPAVIARSKTSVSSQRNRRRVGRRDSARSVFLAV